MPALINRLRVLRTLDFQAMDAMMVVNSTTGCAIWSGGLEKGTRTPYYKGWRVKKEIYVHRNGAIPDGFRIWMSCRNGLCCSDAHMSVRRGGGGAYNVITPNTRGTLNANNVLTEDEVREVRRLYALGNTSYRKLGKIYTVDQSTIGLIIRGERDGKGNWVWLN